VNRGQPSRGGPGRSYPRQIGGLFAIGISTIPDAHRQIRRGYSAAGLKFITPGKRNMDSPVIRGLAISKSLLVHHQRLYRSVIPMFGLQGYVTKFSANRYSNTNR
jgi:hypothetical protein